MAAFHLTLEEFKPKHTEGIQVFERGEAGCDDGPGTPAILGCTVTPCLKISKNSNRQEQQIGNVNSFTLTWFLSGFLSFVPI